MGHHMSSSSWRRRNSVETVCTVAYTIPQQAPLLYIQTTGNVNELLPPCRSHVELARARTHARTVQLNTSLSLQYSKEWQC